MNFVKIKSAFVALLGISLLCVACDKNEDGPVLPTPNPKPQGTIAVELKMTKSDFAYFSFAQNKQIELTEAQAAQNKDWDIAFDMLNGKTNGGASGDGQAAVMVTSYRNFEAIKNVKPYLEPSQEWQWQKDAPTDILSLRNMPPNSEQKVCNPLLTTWYTIQNMAVTVSDHVYIVRTAAGDYVKLQFVSHKGKDGKLGNIQFKYEYIGQEGTNQLPDGEVRIENLKQGDLANQIKASGVKDIHYLTIASGALDNADMSTIKALPMLDVLDLSGATLSLGDESVGFKDFKNIKKLIAPANLESTGGDRPWFVYMSALEELIFPGNTLTGVQESSFAGLPNVKKIVLPNSVEVIGNQAFIGTGLEEFTFPSKVTSIPQNCLSVCKNLRKVTIPASVKELRAGAIYYCKNLRTIVFQGTTPPTLAKKPYDAISDITWDDKDGKPFVHLVVPKGCTETYIKAWGWDLENAKPYFIEQ